jgi:hypothetical protein
MADPVTVNCPANEWTKIATASRGAFAIARWQPDKYLKAWRVSPSSAPDDPALTPVCGPEPAIYLKFPEADFEYSVVIDVYLWPINLVGQVVVST